VRENPFKGDKMNAKPSQSPVEDETDRLIERVETLILLRRIQEAKHRILGDPIR
jgi:hypothetical protein